MISPFLQKGFAPLRAEHDKSGLAVRGALPAELTGTFYRIGPSPQFEPRDPYNPLNGDGMVHAIRLGPGQPSCANRWVRTRQWQADHAAGRSLFGTSGAPHDRDPSVIGLATDGVANTNLVWHAGRLLALEEGNPPFEIDTASLDTRGAWSFRGALPRNMTAHPKIDPASGEMLLIANFESGRGDTLGFHIVDADGAIERSARIACPFAGLIHDFAITERFVIFPFCPAVVSLRRAMAGGPLIAWEGERETVLGVMPRAGGADDVRWFAGPPAMAWHVLNAFDAGGRVTVDVCAQGAAAFPLADGTPPDPSRLTQRLTRWTLDWDAPGAFAARTLNDERCEYPRIDDRLAGRAHRFGYVACRGGPGSDDLFHRGVGRWDQAEGRMDLFDAGPGRAMAEPVFAARPGGGEGQGWLLTNVFDEAAQTSALWVFDAEAVADGPVAEVEIGHHVPVGFHGQWIAA